MKSILKFVLAFFVVIMLTSCGSYFVVGVNAYGDDSYLENKKYILVPGDSTINESSLQYLEFSDYVRKALYAKGYTETANVPDADLMVFLRYGISDPKTFQETYSVPVYGKTGISSINTTSYSAFSSYHSTSTVRPDYGVTGYRQETVTRTKYFRYLILDVYDLNVYKSTGKPKIAWNVVLTSNGSSDDLRLVIPYMIAAGSSYFGKDSGTKQSLTIYENDKRVKHLKSIEETEETEE